MYDALMGWVWVYVIFVVAPSISWDVWIHTDRQDRWEKAHPDTTYVPHYRKLIKKGIIAS